MKSFVQGRLHQLVHHLAGDASVLEFLRACIYACHRCAGSRCLDLGTVVCRVNFRMDYVDLSVEGCRFSEEYECHARLKLLMHPFYALEENHFHFSASVLYPHAHPLDCAVFQLCRRGCLHRGCPVAVKVYPSDCCPYLDVCHIGTCITDSDKGTLVYIAERIEPYQVPYRPDSKFLVQQLSPLRAYSRKKLYLHIQVPLCHSKANLLNVSQIQNTFTIFVS